MKRNSPFTPGKPVPLDLFVGRNDTIDEITQSLYQSCYGSLENVFMLGDRGIGKSSIAHYIRFIAEYEMDMVGIHVFLGGVTTVEGVVTRIIERLINEYTEEKWYNQIKGLFEKYIKSVGAFGVSVTFAPPKDELQGLTKNFPSVLNSVINQLTNDKNGLFIILDDIDGLANNPDFANWYKSFVDEVSVYFDHYPVCMMLVGLHDRRDVLLEHQESLSRVFKVLQIDRLPEADTSEFYRNAFKKVEIDVDKEAMDWLIYWCGGFPTLMHEIGNSVYWEDEDSFIDINDAVGGTLDAADRIGQKYIEPKVYRTLKSDLYRSILRKIGKSMSVIFTRKDMVEQLNQKERNVFGHFIAKLREIGIIEISPGQRGVYEFINPIYVMYIQMEALAYEEELKSSNNIE